VTEGTPRVESAEIDSAGALRLSDRGGATGDLRKAYPRPVGDVATLGSYQDSRLIAPRSWWAVTRV
jgi:hypothetical protein